MRKKLLCCGIIIMFATSSVIPGKVLGDVVAEEKLEYDVEGKIDYEKYVVNLMNDMGEETDTDNWRYNLNFLQDNYDEISKRDNVRMGLVDYYIIEYGSELQHEELQENPDMKRNARTYGSSFNYKSSLAIDYAFTYYNTFNSNYPNWTSEGGDCANFVSQCLFAGGIPMVGTAGQQSAQNESNWFSYGNTLNTSKVSSSFRGANAFKNHYHDRAKKEKVIEKGKSKKEVYELAKMADAISFCNKNKDGKYVAKHTMIVVNKDWDNLKVELAGHTSATYSANLYDRLKNYDMCYAFSFK